MLDNGASDKEVADECFGTWIRYHKGLAAYRAISSAKRDWPTQCIVYWGPSGSGKTRAAADFCPDSTYWVSKPGSDGKLWFTGYSGERCVIVDEFYGWIKRDVMQRLCDRYPMQVPVHGQFTQFLARYVIITSNVDPASWWSKVGLGAMARRLEDPLGAVVYVGNDEFPDELSYKNSLAYLELIRPRDAAKPAAPAIGAQQ